MVKKIAGMMMIALLAVNSVQAQQPLPPLPPLATNTPRPTVTAPTALPPTIPPASLESQQGVIAATATVGITSLETLPNATPVPTVAPVITEPERYTLRLWTDMPLVDLLEAQLQALVDAPSPDRALAVRLTVYELERRFPAAFRRADVQARLVPLALSVPVGSIDARPIMRAYVQTALNAVPSALNPAATSGISLRYASVIVQPINAPAGGDPELLLTIYAPGNVAEADIRYREFAVGRVNNGNFRLLNSTDPLPPAAPSPDFAALELLAVGDLNADGADEIALAALPVGETASSIYIYGVRENALQELTQPGTRIRAAGAVRFDPNTGSLTVDAPGTPNGFWGGTPVQTTVWSWGANQYNPVPSGVFRAADSLACRLDNIGNPYTLPIADAIAQISPLFSSATPQDADTLAHAQLTVALLHILNGTPPFATPLITQALQSVSVDSPRTAQARQLLDAVQRGQAPTLSACTDFAAPAPLGLCDLNTLITRLLNTAPDPVGQDVGAVLAARQIPVAQALMLQSVGRLERPVVEIGVGEGVWVEFVARDGQPQFYNATIIPNPTGSPIPEAAQPFSIRALLPRLLDEDNASAVIRAVLGEPTESLPLDVRYLLAFSYDLSGAREQARVAYLALIEADSGGVWGDLALSHLERRDG